MQAYNFRLILTHDPTNQVPYLKAGQLRFARFALLRRYLTEFEKNKGRAPNFHDVTNPVEIPNHKADFNNNGPVSTDYIGHSWDYPDGSYAVKQKIWNDTVEYIQGFFYFLAHDPSVPPSLQKEVNEWGLSKDEFVDNGYFPNQLYIREGRRMVGVYVMRQADLQTKRTKPDSIGMGSYQSDSHNIQRVAREDGTATNEGDVQVAVQPYEIPFRVMLPQKSQVITCWCRCVCRLSCGVLFGSDGAAVHDHRSGGGCGGESGCSEGNCGPGCLCADSSGKTSRAKSSAESYGCRGESQGAGGSRD